MAMKVTEMREAVRKVAVETLGLNGIEDCKPYDSGKYTFPVVINDGGNRMVYHVKLALTVASDKDTKRSKAFNAEAVTQAYAERIAEENRLALLNEKIAKEYSESVEDSDN